ncbi:MAG: SRPBCC family protein [Candidatus Binatia bacterium]
MTRAYYSTTFAQNADKVWAVIRDFNGFQWAEGVDKSHIENQKGNNEIGAVRDFRYYDHMTRQRLVSHSDSERCYSYASVEPVDTLRSYKQTLHVAPIVDTNTAFVEWIAEFDAPAEEQDRWRKCLMDESAKSLEKLRTYLAEV